MNPPGSSRSERSRASILVILAILAMCISTMLAVQVHREIGHADHLAPSHSARFAHQPGKPAFLFSYCKLCDLKFQAESAPPLPVRVMVNRTPVRVRHDDVSLHFLTVASTAHIWHSRAPPQSPVLIA